MMEKGTCSFHVEHVKLLSELGERAKSNTHRLDNMEKLVDEVHEMNTNISVIASNMANQSEMMNQMLDKQVKTEEEIDGIKSNMETKEDVDKIRERVLDMEKQYGKVAIRAWIYVAGIGASVLSGYILAKLTGG